MSEELADVLETLVRRLVRDEIERSTMQWRWQPVSRVAELLDLSEEAVRRRVLRGQMPGRRLDGRVYVDMVALDRQIEGRLR